MQEKTVSRRKRYTSQVLQEALIDLLEKKNTQQITIVELCERADINRTTFYRNYESIEELRDEALHDLFSKIFRPLQSSTQTPSEKRMRQALNSTQKNRRIIKILIGRTNTGTAVDALRDNLGIFKEPIYLTGCTDDEVEMVYNYFCNGICSLWFDWIERDCQIPINRMEQMLFQIIDNFYTLLNQNFME